MANIRICSHCGKAVFQGYEVFDNYHGYRYFCNDECLESKIGREAYNKYYEDAAGSWGKWSLKEMSLEMPLDDEEIRALEKSANDGELLAKEILALMTVCDDVYCYYNEQFVSINTARNGRNVAWYLDGEGHESARYVDTLEKLTSEEIEDLLV